jgi:response regulator of citrate/malate metabolism
MPISDRDSNVIFQRIATGKLSHKAAHIQGRKRLFLHYILTTDDSLKIIAQYCKISETTARKYYESLVASKKFQVI